MDITKRSSFVDGLRELARLFETRMDIPLPSWKQDISVFVADENPKESLAAAARALGHADKSYGDDLFELHKGFGELLQLRVIAYRNQVCERVILGTRLEPAHEVPAQPAQVVPERVVEVVEWRCSPLLTRGRADIEMEAEKALPAPSQPVLAAGDDDIPW